MEWDEKYSKDSKVIMSSSVFLVLLFSLIVAVFMLIFWETLFVNVLNDISFYPYLFYSIIAIVVTCVIDIYKAYLKAMEYGSASFKFELFYYGTNILLNLFFVVIIGTDVIGLVYSTLICGTVFTLIIFFREN